jgi:hypothetical protein
MATIGNAVPTLLDIATQMDPNGSLATIAEVLTQQNEILQDIPWREGNLPTGERITVRTSLPTATWRLLNNGVPLSKSTTSQVDEACAMLEAFSQVDRKLAQLGGAGNIAQFRARQASPFLEAMNQAFTRALIYGNGVADPEQFTGFLPRYNALTGSTTLAQQVINGGGSGTDLRSILIVSWNGDAGISGIYPRGTKAGLFHEDVTVNKAVGDGGIPVGDVLLDASGNPYMGYRDHWEAVRIANIDPDSLTTDASSGPKLIELLVQGVERLRNPNQGCVIYMPRGLYTYLRLQIANKSNVHLDLAQWGNGGQRVLTFDGHPIRRVDVMDTDEAAVS